MPETKLNYIFFYWLQWLEFQNYRPQRMIVLENFNWLYAARGKTWSNFKLFQYLHWVKETLDTRLCQIWTGLHTDWRLLLTGNILGHLQMNIIRMYKVLSYTKDESLLRICFERKKQHHGYVIQELSLLQNHSTFIAKI